MSVENPRPFRSADHDEAALLSTGKAGTGAVRSGRSDQEQTVVELLRVGDGGRTCDDDDGEGVAQYNDL